MTATRIVTITPAILVTVGTFEIFDIKKRRRLREWRLRDLKNEENYEDRDLDTHHPVTVDTFESLGLAAGDHTMGGGGGWGGAVDTGHDTIYTPIMVPISYSLPHPKNPKP